MNLAEIVWHPLVPWVGNKSELEYNLRITWKSAGGPYSASAYSSRPVSKAGRGAGVPRGAPGAQPEKHQVAPRGGPPPHHNPRVVLVIGRLGFSPTAAGPKFCSQWESDPGPSGQELDALTAAPHGDLFSSDG